MNRIMITGTNAGAGKSTFARLLGKKLDINPTHLDTFFWKPGWEMASPDEMTTKIKEVLNKDRWIIDGSYTKYLFEERIKLADTIFFFDFNRFVCIYSAIKRRIMYHNKERQDMGKGCIEKFDLVFFKFMLFDAHKNKKYKLDLVNNIKDKKVVIFKNRKQVNEYLSSILEV